VCPSRRRRTARRVAVARWLALYLRLVVWRPGRYGDPGRLSAEVLAGELEEIEGHEVQLGCRRRIALKRGFAYRGEVLDDRPWRELSANEFSVKD
jgi:hypothetical protein